VSRFSGKGPGHEGALTVSRHTAVVFLIPFGVLLILMMWAYVKVCVVASRFDWKLSSSAGLFNLSRICKRRACCYFRLHVPRRMLIKILQHVQPTPRPEVPPRHPTRDLGGPPYRNGSSPSSPTQHGLAPPPVQHDVSRSSSDHTALQSEDTASPSQLIAIKEQYPPGSERRPPSTPILAPAHRYCGREGLIKPLRAHHCKACGKVCTPTRKSPHTVTDVSPLVCPQV